MKGRFKKNKEKLDLLTHIDMLLMTKKGIRGGIFHSIHRCAKANKRYMKYYAKNKESSYLQYCDPNGLYGWAFAKDLPENSFEWFKRTFQFYEDFIKKILKNVMEVIFLKLMLQKLGYLNLNLFQYKSTSYPIQN